MVTRTEKAPHSFQVGDTVREKWGARHHGRIVGMLPFEGGGLEIENGLIEIESLGFRPTRWVLGHGAIESAVRP